MSNLKQESSSFRKGGFNTLKSKHKAGGMFADFELGFKCGRAEKYHENSLEMLRFAMSSGCGKLVVSMKKPMFEKDVSEVVLVLFSESDAKRLDLTRYNGSTLYGDENYGSFVSSIQKIVDKRGETIIAFT